MGRCTRVLIGICMALVIWLGHPTASYVLELSVDLDSNSESFTRFNVAETSWRGGTNFISCLCESKESCTTQTSNLQDGPRNTKYNNITRDDDNSKNKGNDSYFVCVISDFFNEMVCERKRRTIIPCSTNPCSVNIIINCTQDSKVTLIWSGEQQARVYANYKGVLENCCSVIQTTTTDLTSTTTTPTTTTPTTTTPTTTTPTTTTPTTTTPTPTTPTTTTPTTTTPTTTTPTPTTPTTTTPTTTTPTTTTPTTTTPTTTTPTPTFPTSTIPTTNSTHAIRSTSPKEDSFTINSTRSFPSKQSTTTTKTVLHLPLPSVTPPGSNNSAQSLQDKQSGDSSSQFSGIHIGVIIGTALAAVILTIIIMCIIWKIKTRSKDKPTNQTQPDKPNHGSTNQTNSSNNVIRAETNDSQLHQPETSTVFSPVVSYTNEDEYNRISQAYNYIDVNFTTNLTANKPGHKVPPDSPQDSTYGTDVETDASDTSNVYSHLGESARPENPYNHWSAEQDNDAYSLANLIDSSQETNQSLDNKSPVRPVNNITKQQTSTPESENKQPQKKENISKPAVNYTEIDLTTKVSKQIDNHNSASGQQTANALPSKRDQILPQAKSNNTYYDIELTEHNNVTETKLSNPVYTSQAEIDTNPITPTEEPLYTNIV